MTKLKPSKKAPDKIPLWLNFKSPATSPQTVYDIQKHRNTEISLTGVNRSQNLDLRYCVYRVDGLPVESGTMRAYKEFFGHYGFSPSEVDKTLTEATKKYPPDIVLVVTLNRWVYHDDKEFMKFCNAPDSIIITTGDDETLYGLRMIELNRFWESKQLPYRFVIIETKPVIV